jgi:chromosome segregation ATPase
MRKHIVKLAPGEKHLPSIKKTKTYTNEGHVPSSQMDPSSLSPRSSQSKIVSNRIFQVSSPHLHQKLQNLKKVFESQETKIQSLEQDCSKLNPSIHFKSFKSFKALLDSPQNEEVSFHEEDETFHPEEIPTFPEESLKNKYKDLEIFRLKKKIELGQEKIKSLAQSKEKLMKELEEYENHLEIIDNCEVEMNVIKMACNQDVHKIYKQVTDSEIQISEMVEDAQELSDLLKKSEEKRSYSNEYNIFLESNSEKLKNRVEALQKEKDRILEKIENVRCRIEEKKLKIVEIEEQIAEIEEELERMKEVNIEVFRNYQIAEESLEASLEKHEFDRVRFKKEFEKLETQIEELSNESDSIEKFSTAKQIVDKVPGLKSRHEANLKLKEKTESLIKGKSELQSDLENLKKNEIYLKNQLISKDLIIKKLENLLKSKEDHPKHLERSKPDQLKPTEHLELFTLIDQWIERFASLQKSLTCSSCSLMIKKDLTLLNPCGHLTCQDCLSHQDPLCKSCKTSTREPFQSHFLQMLFNSLKIEQKFLTKAKKIMDSFRSPTK